MKRIVIACFLALFTASLAGCRIDEHDDRDHHDAGWHHDDGHDHDHGDDVNVHVD